MALSEEPPASKLPATATGTSYARKATGLVREIPLVDMIAFNMAGPGGIVVVLLVSIFYAFGSFPGGNLVLALIIGLVLIGFIWLAFALVGSVFPRVGGDYTYGSRVLHPIVGLSSNLGVLVSTILTLGFWAALVDTSVLVSPALAVVGVTTGHPSWVNAANTITHHGWQIGIAVGATLIISVLSAVRTRLITRIATICLGISYVGFFIAFFILLFTSHPSFVHTLNAFSAPITHQANSYSATVAAGAKAGLYPSQHGYSVRSTIGMVYVGIVVSLFVWWGVYMSGEMKGAGQRKRQLTSILGAGYIQGILVILGVIVFLKTVGYNFLVSANAGNYKVPVTPFYTFFASVAAGNHFVAILLALSTLGSIPPGMYILFAMVQRALFAYSFDGLLPKRVAEVNDRTHTPIVAIVIVSIGTILCAIYSTYAASFLTLLSITASLLFLPMFVTGVCGLVLPKRQPELFRGSPADWTWHRIPMLKVASVGCIVISLAYIVMLGWFHTELGIKSVIVVPLIVPGSFLVGWLWYTVARALQRRRGIDLALVYREIPPE